MVRLARRSRAELQTTELGDFLSDTLRRERGWGVLDCFLFAADWVQARRGVDPAAAYRGRYDSEIGAKRFMVQAGGFEALVDVAMAGCGLVRTSAPVRGDVAMIDLPYLTAKGVARELTCAICTSVTQKVVVTLDRGFVFGKWPHIAAWAV
jgi:hypothetical protein